ncbi:glycoside hydrolase family 55 protein [Cylindrobasidium torrendii FP15055 ss-10]|uniref:Glycoside hydrolase family 55 protein n=1 Tax=Cylindrobasidium torrendii FP15055 ss-10 TaxID=1314674 RepID=A0A0D7BE19_9AGAR|nr:glycoside hydrolase family 55 protein [Cylindrobasidium torrendii FP15055 ss-10]
MLPTLLWAAASSCAFTLVSALGSACDAPLGAGAAAASDPFWLESIKHQGTAAFNPDPANYVVFRNVKDYGAVGDGSADDTEAINKAITDGDRCGGADGNICNSTTITPAIVYFPSGTYSVSAPIIAYYTTQLIGDAKNLPTIEASADFAGLAVIDADPYIDGGNGAQWYYNTNNFFRSVRNFKIDTTKVDPATSATGIHWQVSQATSLMNVVFEMAKGEDSKHQGIFMENGSGGYMGDLVFNGGLYGMWVGNQQFTVRNITVNDANTAVFGIWNWGWTFQRVTINNCEVGFDLVTGVVDSSTLTDTTNSLLNDAKQSIKAESDDQTLAGEAIIDAVVSETPIFIRSSEASTSLAGSLVLNNIQLTNVPTAVGVADGTVVLEGGSITIDSWGQGNVYKGTDSAGTFTQGEIVSAKKPESLLDSNGHIFGKMHPQYESYSVDQIVSVKAEGAVGDGKTDDTKALQDIFDKHSGCSILFFDAGTYVVSDTVTIPAGTQMIGEAWTVLAGKGEAFQDMENPKVVFKVGESGDKGVTEISNIIFQTIGPAAGAIVVEWNVAEPDGVQGGAGMWDSYIRLGGSEGSEQDLETCPSTQTEPTDACMSAFMALHLTAGSTAYLEGTWVWLADHFMDGDGYSRLSLYSGRGILSHSSGPVWMIGTGSEHHTLYQYSLVNASNHYMGLIQTETPYFQPTPLAPEPFTVRADYNDPTFEGEINEALGLNIANSNDIFIFGAGLYSFFDSYTQECLDTRDCQKHIANIDSASSVTIYQLNTVATTNQLSIDGKGIISQADNLNGFTSTVTVWSQ